MVDFPAEFPSTAVGPLVVIVITTALGLSFGRLTRKWMITIYIGFFKGRPWETSSFYGRFSAGEHLPEGIGYYRHH